MVVHRDSGTRRRAGRIASISSNICCIVLGGIGHGATHACHSRGAWLLDLEKDFKLTHYHVGWQLDCSVLVQVE
jgi:hypothetical protein